MLAKHTILMLLLLAIVVVGSIGILGGVICSGQLPEKDTPVAHLSKSGAMVENTNLYSLPLERAIGLLFVNAAGPAFCAPGISRARSQVYQNENRKQIIKFIADNPGSRLYDITKALNMNIGTLRYHLMILSLNHLLVPYQDGGSYIRYFTKASSYSEEQMKIMSLLKREPTSKLLGALAGQAGMTNAKISVASGLHYSDVNRYLKELIAKDVVVKEQVGKDKYQYRIAPDNEEYITKNIRLQG